MTKYTTAATITIDSLSLSDGMRSSGRTSAVDLERVADAVHGADAVVLQYNHAVGGFDFE